MKRMLSDLRVALLATVSLAILVCGVYPLAVWGVAQMVFPDEANGSLIRDSAGYIAGSSLLGQRFDAPQYFHPRPSAAGSGYDASNSSGSNYGLLSQKLNDSLSERVKQYREENHLANNTPIPADAVTASGSGLDPHISPANAMMQAPRVAQARSLDIATVRRAIHEHTEGPQLGILGERRVNVLLLNLALDKVH